MNEPTVTMV